MCSAATLRRQQHPASHCPVRTYDDDDDGSSDDDNDDDRTDCHDNDDDGSTRASH